MSEGGPGRTLLCLLVHRPLRSEQDFVASALRFTGSDSPADLLVLDNRELSPAWSESLAQTCAQNAMEYYRPPRRLTLARLMNLLLNLAGKLGSRYLLTADARLLLPAELVNTMVRAALQDPDIASVGSWDQAFAPLGAAATRTSGLDPVPPAEFDQEAVDWVSSTLEAAPLEPLDLPFAGPGCLLIPLPKRSQTGLFDPIYRQDSTALIDWSRRSASSGSRHILAPAAFAYDPDRAEIATGQDTGAGTEHALLDMRFPGLNTHSRRFALSSAPDELVKAAKTELVIQAAARWGYRIVATWLKRPRAPGREVEFIVEPESSGRSARAEYLGFTVELALDPTGILPALRGLVGANPTGVHLYDTGGATDRLIEEAGQAGVALTNSLTYPERV